MLPKRLSPVLASVLLAITVIARGSSPADSALAYGLENQKGALVMWGSAFVHGAQQKFRLTFDRSFRYRLDVSGALPQTDGYDGHTTWTDGTSRVPHGTYTLERDSCRLALWTILGLWADRHAPIQMGSADGPARAIRPRDGKLSATLVEDPATGLANSLMFDAAAGRQTWQFEDYKDFQGRVLPTHFVLHSGSQDDVYDVDGVAPEPNPDFESPLPDPGPFSYDAKVSPQVEVKRIAGYLFVRPKVDGKDVGWFFLDCGADVMCLDPTIVKKLALPRVGSDTTAGAVAVAQFNLDQGTTLQVGPAILQKPVYLEFDLKDMAKAFGIPVAGVLGYDLFARTIIDIDPKASTISILDPNLGPFPRGMHWAPMTFSGNSPVIEADYAPDHHGSFHLDTGSGNTVDFFSPTVTKYRLGQGPDVKKTTTGGAGGSAQSLEGKIAWFDLGGERILTPTVGFQTAQAGAFSTPYEDGNIGMGFMGKFHVIFDYVRRRVGFALSQ